MLLLLHAPKTHAKGVSNMLCIMLGLGATDLADLEAQARAELGFSRRLEQP